MRTWGSLIDKPIFAEPGTPAGAGGASNPSSVSLLLPALSSTFIAYTSATFLHAGQRIQCLYCMGTVSLRTCATGLVTLLLL